MASERQRAANRRNAQRSTGPRTASGKAVSRRNALRHGLSARLGTDSGKEDQIEALARILAGSEANSAELHYARIAAAASLQIARIRALRTTLMDPAASRSVFRGPTVLFSEATFSQFTAWQEIGRQFRGPVRSMDGLP